MGPYRLIRSTAAASALALIPPPSVAAKKEAPPPGQVDPVAIMPVERFRRNRAPKIAETSSSTD
jgi:hypothetical protein